jgi:hypothetical protein
VLLVAREHLIKDMLVVVQQVEVHILLVAVAVLVVLVEQEVVHQVEQAALECHLQLMAHRLQERVVVVVCHLLILVVLVVLQLPVEPPDLIQLPQTMEQQILVVAVAGYLLQVVAEQQVAQAALGL